MNKYILPYDRIPDSLDQKGTNMCSAFATAGIFQILYYLKTGERKQFSPAFIYANYMNENNLTDRGLFYKELYKGWLNIGAVFYEDFPYMTLDDESFKAVKGNKTLLNKAKGIKIAEYFDLSGGRKQNTFNNIKEAIAIHKLPIFAEIEARRNHAVCLVGWQDDELIYRDSDGLDRLRFISYNKLKNAIFIPSLNLGDDIMADCYSVKKDGKTYLSKHFQVREFACKDGSDTVLIDSRLVYVLEKIREYFGKPICITSGYRNREYNKKIGGAVSSQHIFGTASDIYIDGVLPRKIAEFAESLMSTSGGIGLYSNFAHIDVRQNRSRWDSTSGKEIVVSGFWEKKEVEPMKDVSKDKWYYEPIKEAYDLGIVKGNAEGCIEPEKPITKAECIQMILNYHKSRG